MFSSPEQTLPPQQHSAHFPFSKSRVVSSALDITRAAAEFSRDCSLVFVLNLEYSSKDESATLKQQELILGAIADAFGQDLWHNKGDRTTHCPCDRSQDATDTPGATTRTNGSVVRKQLYPGRTPCKSETHYISVSGIPSLQPVISVHNVHTLIQPLDQYTLDDESISIVPLLDSLYLSRPSFVSPIDGLQVMKDVYRLVDLARQQDDENSQEEQLKTNSGKDAPSAVTTSDSDLLRKRDQECWKSVRHAVEVIEEAVKRYGYVRDVVFLPQFVFWPVPNEIDSFASLLDLAAHPFRSMVERTAPSSCIFTLLYSTRSMAPNSNPPQIPRKSQKDNTVNKLRSPRSMLHTGIHLDKLSVLLTTRFSGTTWIFSGYLGQ